MAKNYGDIPCVKLKNHIHITKSATQCICGREWKYASQVLGGTRSIVTNNIIWRKLEAVTCPECREIYCKEKNIKDYGFIKKGE